MNKSIKIEEKKEVVIEFEVAELAPFDPKKFEKAEKEGKVVTLK